MSIIMFCHWLGATNGSTAIRESVWVYPIVETTHVLALCVFLGLVALLDLRLLGVAIGWIPVSEVQHRLFPVTMAGFALMVISGTLLWYSDPVRFYGNVFFRVKLILLALAGLNAVIFHRTIYQRVSAWDLERTTPLQARLAGAFSLTLWTGVVVVGRLIAYNWFDPR